MQDPPTWTSEPADAVIRHIVEALTEPKVSGKISKNASGRYSYECRASGADIDALFEKFDEFRVREISFEMS